jgi:hypothetical protein
MHRTYSRAYADSLWTDRNNPKGIGADTNS